jgi:hypothetical protein
LILDDTTVNFAERGSGLLQMQRKRFTKPDSTYIPDEPGNIDIDTFDNNELIDYIWFMWEYFKEKNTTDEDQIDELEKKQKTHDATVQNLMRMINSSSEKSDCDELKEELEKQQALVKTKSDKITELRERIKGHKEEIKTKDNLITKLNKVISEFEKSCDDDEFKEENGELDRKLLEEFKDVFDLRNEKIWTPREKKLVKTIMSITIPKTETMINYCDLLTILEKHTILYGLDRKNTYPLMKHILLNIPHGRGFKVKGIQFLVLEDLIPEIANSQSCEPSD